MKDSPIKLPEMNSNEFAQNKFYVFTTVIVKAITIQLKRLAFTGRNIDTNKWNLRKKNYRDAAFINVLSVGRNLLCLCLTSLFLDPHLFSNLLCIIVLVEFFILSPLWISIAKLPYAASNNAQPNGPQNSSLEVFLHKATKLRRCHN